MKSTFSRMAAVVLTMWLGFAAGTANASSVTLSSWTATPGGGYAAGFFNVVGTSFNDWINFSLPSPSSGTGNSNVINLSTYGSVVFDTFELWNTVTSSLITDALPGSSTASSSVVLFFAGETVPGSYQLRIGGYSDVDGSYAGQILVSPVPEPETFAMLLAGLGLLGFSARRRNNNT